MPQPQNVIGIVYDFDKTLSPKSMQEETLFPLLSIDEKAFWKQVDGLVCERHYENELAWMHLLLEDKGFRQLSNSDLRLMGSQLSYYPGVPNIFSELSDEIEKSDIVGPGSGAVRLEHYIITSGLREILEGSQLSSHVKAIFGSEFDEDYEGKLSFPKRTVGHTQKTQYLFRVSKGYLDLHEDVNDQLPDQDKPIPLHNMIYVGDGASDVPCFSVMRSAGGRTIGVYDPKDEGSFTKCMQLRKAARVTEVAEADYQKGTHLWRLLVYMIHDIAAEIKQDLHDRNEPKVIPAPKND